MTTETTALLEALHDPDNHTRSRAALRLGDIREAVALDALVQALAIEADLNVREDMTWALVRLGDAAVPLLVTMLRDPDAAARHNAAHTLGKIGDARAVDGLSATLRDQDEAVRLKSAFALGQIGDARAIPALLTLLGGDLRDVQMLNEVLPGFGAAAVPALSAALADERQEAREQAADLLGMIGDKAAVPALTQALSDSAWQVRFAAVSALGEVGAGQAAVSLVDDENPQVRAMARRTAGQGKR